MILPPEGLQLQLDGIEGLRHGSWRHSAYEASSDVVCVSARRKTSSVRTLRIHAATRDGMPSRA